VTDRDTNGRMNGRHDGHYERASEPCQVILVMAGPGAISHSMIHAIERELPWVLVEHRSEAAAGPASCGHPVSLILVDVIFLRSAEAAASEILQQHPHAIAALIEPANPDALRALTDVTGSPLIRGVLPMNMRLDVWLSVVRLMLCGGEYFPPHMLRAKAREGEAIGPAEREPARLSHTPANGHLGGLTAREIQILEMVSRGLQNKSIATAFSLSEHTVKIHLHNIIGKLGVHNRTEAAARFRDGPKSHFRDSSGTQA